jgi:lysyl-tRNA synthetase class II
MSDNNSTINSSSIDFQRRLRNDKATELRARGFDPYPVDSHRDFSIGFVKFWFDLVNKFDFSKLDPDEDNFLLEYFLSLIIFPPTLLETLEEKIHFRHTARQMGIDPDEEEITSKEDEADDNEIIEEIKKLLPNNTTKSKEEKEKLLANYLKVNDENEDNSGMTRTFVKGDKITIAGRLKTKRTSGKIAFGVLEDESCPEGFQLVFKSDVLNQSFEEKLKSSFSIENLKSILEVE